MILIIIWSLINCWVNANISGITYAPYLKSGCLTSSQIESEIKSISQLTERIRLYGADCNQIPSVLDALKNNDIPMKVLLGIWTRGGNDRFQNDIKAVIDAVSNPDYQSLVEGIVVGNEELYNGIKEDVVINNLKEVRKQLNEAQQNIPISYVEVFNLWSPELAKESDVIMPSIYPFYTNNNQSQSVADSAITALEEINNMLTKLNTDKPLVIAETGFPVAGEAPVMFAPPNQDNQCEYLISFACQAQSRNIPYYFLEAKNAYWKGGHTTEQYFGILNQSNRFKCDKRAFQC